MASHPRKTAIRAGMLASACALMLVAPAAMAHESGYSFDGAYENGKSTHAHHQHGGEAGHLPASSKNVDVVSKLRLTKQAGRIADVGVHKGYAYLTAYYEPRCKNTGAYIVDIRDPQNPKQVAFVKTSKGSYAGEGSQTIIIDTPKFSGDVLAFNNEICDAGAKEANGGMTLVDVSNPAKPKYLAQHAGDIGEDGKANEIHSIFLWQSGEKAYAVLVDDLEATDVDIMDITDPRNPTMVREYDLAKEFPQILQSAPDNLTEVFLHDMIVKEIAGRQVMLLSYWDAGYVTLDVTDPANASFIADSDFTDPDPELQQQAGIEAAPEGNAHQAEFTKDNNFVLAADEDFSPTFLNGTTDDGWEFTGSQGSDTPQLGVGEQFGGTTVYGGRACNGDDAVPAAPAEGDAQIAVLTRGLCTFTEKVANVTNAGGYEGIIVVNREGSCGAFGMTVDGDVPTFSADRETGFAFFDKENEYDHQACLAGGDTLDGSLIPGVALGAIGDVATISVDFNGWGYVHLFANTEGKLTELDTYAIPEAMDPHHSAGSGDLSVHEVAVSDVENDLAYFAYYAGGFRVTRIAGDSIEEVGHFIDQGGNNFWGVQVFEHDGQEYVAASDRDYGLYIFSYTGP
ncbi:MAG: hypothetical protein GEV04_17455 [Actinophytocola sp.]|nr:hypothetical protein [Actinophytocola sp.]